MAKKLNHTQFEKVVNKNAIARQERLAKLHEEIDEFFYIHLNNMSYLVDGNFYNLQITVKAPKSSDQNFI